MDKQDQKRMEDSDSVIGFMKKAHRDSNTCHALPDEKEPSFSLSDDMKDNLDEERQSYSEMLENVRGDSDETA